MIFGQRLALRNQSSMAGVADRAAAVRGHHTEQCTRNAAARNRLRSRRERLFNQLLDHAAVAASSSGRGLAPTMKGRNSTAAMLIVPAMMKNPSWPIAFWNTPE